MPPIMPPNHFFNPLHLGAELGFTLIVLLFCFLVFFKTRELYNLTKYKGIKYFRTAFLFFVLAYSFRLVFSLLVLAGITLDYHLPMRMVMQLSLPLTGYFSTMAVLMLLYSTLWKRMSSEKFLIIANASAVVLSMLAFVSNSPILLSITQAGFIIATAVASFMIHRKSKKFSQLFILYTMIFLFWAINLSVTGPRNIIPFHIKMALQALSIVMFIIIYHKVAKWTK